MLEEAASTRPEHRYKVVAWSEDGESFSIYNHEEFMKQFVSRYFKLSKYRSFVSVWCKVQYSDHSCARLGEY